MLYKLWEPVVKKASKKTDPKEQIEILKKFAKSRAYKKAARSIPKYILKRINSQSLKDWRSALQASRKLDNSVRIYNGLRRLANTPIGRIRSEIISENAKYISNMPNKLADEVSHFVQREAEKGRRSESIAEEVSKMLPGITRSRVRLIARTQVAMAQAALVEARSLYYGRYFYVWRTAGDERVRTSHNVMNGVICDFRDPPSPEQLANNAKKFRQLKSGPTPWKLAGNYNPGGVYNCRCIAEVLITLNQVSWPHKVYYKGKIQRMTEKQFKEVSGWH